MQINTAKSNDQTNAERPGKARWIRRTCAMVAVGATAFSVAALDYAASVGSEDSPAVELARKAGKGQVEY